MRLCCRDWNNFISSHEHLISTAYERQQDIPRLPLILFPRRQADAESANSASTLQYLTGLRYRFKAVVSLARSMTDWITVFLFLRRTPTDVENFKVFEEQIRQRLVPILLLIFHFFEKLRSRLVQRVRTGKTFTPKAFDQIQRTILSEYSNTNLLHMHEVFPLFIAFVSRRLGGGSYITILEREGRLQDEALIALLCIGGLAEIAPIVAAPDFPSRRSAFCEWYGKISRKPPYSKSRMYKYIPLRLVVPREKSKHHDGGDATEVEAEASTSRNTASHYHSAIPATSMAGGPPMGPLSSSDASGVFANLPGSPPSICTPISKEILKDRNVIRGDQDLKKWQEVLSELCSLSFSSIDVLMKGTAGEVSTF
jgi:hypothetical protein